ncbi:unnamed protein product [Paramecium sonneborni]|uniref:Uncharacterized protein n=1 Tax=Paramecium sonneborni TaxID=65129 RepID=A0A8S1PAK0_9CILI|nr:unnamed protein product [Paramecium sonneborni]
MNYFLEFTRQQVSDRFINVPKVCNEIGTKWLIGYNHLIESDEDYEKYKEGINQDQAQDLLIQDIDTSKIVLQYEFDEKYGEQAFQQLNLGCQYLLLSIMINTGRVLHYSKLIQECQNNNFYKALQFNKRKHINNENQNNILQVKYLEEKKFFEEHFDEQGNGKKQGIWKLEIPQVNEEDLAIATEIVNDRYQTLELFLIFAIDTNLESCNHKSVEWLEFLRDQEGRKYDLISYNQEQNKWYPVNVSDQEYQIIGYSHICNPKEVLAYKNGLTDGQVNYLFMADYDSNCLKLRRFLKQEYPTANFDDLTSQAQLLLIDLSFRNWPLVLYKKSIDLALENKIQEAILESYIYYRPNEKVNAHYLCRQDEINAFLNKISSTYRFQPKINNNFWQNPNLNNIVGVKITENNFSFVLDEQAQTKIQISDLITFLKVYYDPQFAEYQIDMTFSLEPEENDQEMNQPFQQKIYFPQYLEGTTVGEVLYQADFLLKQMSLGIEVLQREPLQTRPFEYGNLDIQPLYKLDPEYFARLFLKIGKLKLNIIEDKHNHIHKLVIEKIDMAVDAKVVNEQLQDEVIQDENNGAYRFAKQFAKIYDSIGEKYPVLFRLRQVLMANYLAKYMFEKGIPMNYKFIEEIFNQNLIPNYQPFKSPNLKLNVEDDKQIIDIRGGIDGCTDEINDELKNKTQELENDPSKQIVELNQENLEAKIQRNDSLDSLSTQESLDTSLLQQKQQCQKCKQELEQCEIQVDEVNIICQSCKGQKCSKCQKFYNNTLQQIENQIYCKECIKCHQCNKLGPRSMSGSFFLHDNCIEISKNSSLRKELIAFIKLKFATKTKQADNNNKTIYFYCDPYPFLNLPNYLGYIIGYNHPLFKDKTQIDPKKHKITQGQADKYLETDLDQFEIQLYEFYQRNNRKIEDISENIRMLMLAVLFIFKDFETVQNLAFLQTFNHLYKEIEKFQYPKTKGPNILKTHIEKVLDFFKDRFHRKDGTVRQQNFINDIKKILPTKKRN